ncbi:hypothetical protein GCM10010270_72230 [Streptomyces violaceus]|nr:hypothetical protein GCM10010270_72230 [Streptomyces janthinus]
MPPAMTASFLVIRMLFPLRGRADRAGRLDNETAGPEPEATTLAPEVTYWRDVPRADLHRHHPPGRYGGTLATPCGRIGRGRQGDRNRCPGHRVDADAECGGNGTADHGPRTRVGGTCRVGKGCPKNWTRVYGSWWCDYAGSRTTAD